MSSDMGELSSPAILPCIIDQRPSLANSCLSAHLLTAACSLAHGYHVGGYLPQAEISPADILSVVGGLGLATAHLFTQNWTLNNLMVRGAMLQARRMRCTLRQLPSCAVACLIASDILQLVSEAVELSASCVCGDSELQGGGPAPSGPPLVRRVLVLWYQRNICRHAAPLHAQVFGSPSVVGNNVMLTVATSDVITGPSRLLFPRELGGVGEVRSVRVWARCA
eukprot:154616-Pelagomonas_calceolata.AAC.1